MFIFPSPSEIYAGNFDWKKFSDETREYFLSEPEDFSEEIADVMVETINFMIPVCIVKKVITVDEAFYLVKCFFYGDVFDDPDVNVYTADTLRGILLGALDNLS